MMTLCIKISSFTLLMFCMLFLYYARKKNHNAEVVYGLFSANVIACLMELFALMVIIKRKRFYIALVKHLTKYNFRLIQCSIYPVREIVFHIRPATRVNCSDGIGEVGTSSTQPGFAFLAILID